MIRCGVNDKQNPLIVAGLSEENINRLKADKPIRAEIRSFGVDLPGHLAIVYGRTEADLEAMFREHNLIGPGTHVVRNDDLDRQTTLAQNHQRILIATVGLPRSGKTTWAQKQSWPIVNPDSIRLALHGERFIEQAEPFVWAIAKTMVSALFLAGHKHVILDATNTTRKRRDDWKSPRWTLFFKHIDTSRQVCLRRAEEAKDEEIVPVIARMAGAFEPLADDEARW